MIAAQTNSLPWRMRGTEYSLPNLSQTITKCSAVVIPVYESQKQKTTAGHQVEENSAMVSEQQNNLSGCINNKNATAL